MKKKYLVGVNYGTSNLIDTWVSSFRSCCQDINVIIVNNYHSDIENEKVDSLKNELSFDVIHSENIGYGRALNKAFNIIKSQLKSGEDAVIFSGNLDIEFVKIPKSFESGKLVHVPIALEGKRNRNPFLTVAQKKIIRLHEFSIKSNNKFVFLSVILALKMAAIFPSSLWAVHGSLFCFDSSCLSDDMDIFNENTFLYSEELEFASYMESIGATLMPSQIVYNHMAHAATHNIISDKNKFFNTWKPSFCNWLRRWNFERK